MSPEKEAFYTNFILIIRIETSIFRGDMLTMLVFGSVFFPKNHERTFSLGSCGKIHVCLWQWARQQTILLQPEPRYNQRFVESPGKSRNAMLWCISHICLEQISIKLYPTITSALGLCWSGETLRNANSKQLLHESARYVVKWIGRFCAWMTSQLLWLLVANISELGSHRTIDKVHIIALGLCKPQPHVF